MTLPTITVGELEYHLTDSVDEYLQGSGNWVYVQIGCGSYGSPRCYVGSDGIDSALDAAAADCGENAPGLLSPPEYPLNATGDGCSECGRSFPEMPDGICECFQSTETDHIGLDCGRWFYSPDVFYGDASSALSSHVWAWAIAETLTGPDSDALDDLAEDIANVVWRTGEETHPAPTLDDGEYVSPDIDIRLCVERDGRWQLRWGPVDYDPHHSPICVASTVTLHTTEDECRTEAASLIEQAVDAAWEQAHEVESV